mgnify:FL=1
MEISFESVKSSMEQLGTYRPEYDPIITAYVDLWEQYIAVQKRLKRSRYKSSVESAQGTQKKSYDVGQHEALRKDILAYSDRLRLNPKAMMDEPSSTAGGALAKVLSSFES